MFCSLYFVCTDEMKLIRGLCEDLGGSGGMFPPGKFENLGCLRWHFLHFEGVWKKKLETKIVVKL